jgi:hypothetical protein
MTAQTRPAKGAIGFLIWSGQDYLFRVYDGQGDFKDYNMLHSDLEITILDTDATLYEYPNGTLSLDHNPETLGL